MRSSQQPSEASNQSSPDEAEHESSYERLKSFLQTHWRRIAFAALWLVGAFLSVKFDVNALQLYLILTVFFLIFTNLGKRRTGPSAYSVFNPNCQPILGQLSAEQFENEVRRRAVYVNSYLLYHSRTSITSTA